VGRVDADERGLALVTVPVRGSREAYRGVQRNVPPATCVPLSTQAFDDCVRVALPIIRPILAKRGGEPVVGEIYTNPPSSASGQ